MTTAIKRRRGTTAQHATFTGLEGELTVDTTKDTVVVHDGATAGGFPLLKEANPTFTGVLSSPAGTVSAPAITTTGDTNTGIFFPAADTIAFTEGGVESMRIDSSGNVGIGTSSPQAKLDVRTAAGTASKINIITGSSAATSTLQMGQSGSVFWDTSITATDGHFQIGINGGGLGYNINRSGTAISYHSWLTAGSERMRIDSAGNVGIGTSSPAARLEVVTGGTSQMAVRAGTTASNSEIAARASDFSSTFTNTSFLQYGSTASGTTAGISNASLGVMQFINCANGLIYTNGATPIVFGTTSAERMRIDSSGNVGIGNTVATTINSANNGGNLVVGSGAGSEGITVYSGNSTNENGVINFADGTSGDSTYRGIIAYTHNIDAMTLWTAAAERMRIDSSGNAFVGGTSAPVLGYEKFGVYGTGGFKTASAYALGLWNTAGSGLVNFYTEAGGTSAGTISGNAGALTIAAGNNLNLTANGANVMTFTTNSTERMRIDASGNVRVGTAALATTATNGFLYIPTCAGVPTGTPTAITGLAPMVIDSTNNKLYIYSGGAWVALN